MSKIWKTPMDKPLRSAQLVKRVIIDEQLPAGWPVKWGKQWDITINNKLIPTGLTSLTWTGNQWKEFILKHSNNNDRHKQMLRRRM